MKSSVTELPASVIGHSMGRVNDIAFDTYAIKYELNQTKDAYVKELSEKDRIIQELLEKRNQLRDYQAISAEREDLRSELHGLIMEKNAAEDLAQKLALENKRLRDELNDMKSKYGSGSTEAQILQTRLDSTEQRLEALKKRLHDEKEKSKQAEILMAQSKNKLESIVLDHNASNMKTELLIEEITQLKLLLADKENEVIEIKEKTDREIRNAQAVTSTHHLLVAENESLQQQLTDSRKQKYQADQQVLKLRIELNNLNSDLAEKDVAVKAAKDRLVKEQESAQTIQVKCSKYIEAARQLKSIITERDHQIEDLKRKISDQELYAKRREDHIRELQLAKNELMEFKADRDILERRLQESQMDKDNIQNKCISLQKTLDNQTSINKKLQNELSTIKKTASQAMTELDQLKYDKVQSTARYEGEIKVRDSNIEELNDSLRRAQESLQRARIDFDDRVEELTQSTTKRVNEIETEKMALLNEADEKYRKLQLETSKRIQDLESLCQTTVHKAEAAASAKIAHVEQASNQKVAELEIKCDALNRTLAKTQGRIEEVELENTKLRNFRESVLDILPHGPSEDVAGNIKMLQESRDSTVSVLNAMNAEMKRCKKENAGFIKAMTGMDIEAATPQELLTVLTSALEGASAQIADLEAIKQASVAAIQPLLPNVVVNSKELPNAIRQAISAVREEKEKEKKRANELRRSLESAKKYIEFEDPQDLASAVSQLKTELNSTRNDLTKKTDEVNTMLTNVNHVVAVKDLASLPTCIKKLDDLNKKTNKTLEEAREELAGTKEKLEEARTNLQNTQNQLYQMQSRVSSIVPIEDISSIPVVVENLKTDINRLSKMKNGVLEAIGIEDETQIPFAVKNIVMALEKAEKVRDEHQKNLAEIQQSIGAFTPEAVATKLAELKEKTAAFNDVSHKLSTIDGVNIGNAAQVIRSIKQELMETSRNHDNFINAMKQLVNVSSENEIPKAVRKLTTSFEQLKNVHSTLMDELRGVNSHMSDAKNEQEIVAGVKLLSSQIDEASKLLVSLVALVLHKKTSEISLSFPLAPQTMLTIQSSFKDFVAESDQNKQDIDVLLGRARGLGFLEGTNIEALEFIVDTEVKTKSSELLIDSVNKLKQVREENAKERATSQARIKDLNLKIQELRDQKTVQIDQSLQKQAELTENIDKLNKEIREYKGQVGKLTRVREELIRYAAKESYDIETLTTQLQPSERRRLNL